MWILTINVFWPNMPDSMNKIADPDFFVTFDTDTSVFGFVHARRWVERSFSTTAALNLDE